MAAKAPGGAGGSGLLVTGCPPDRPLGQEGETVGTQGVRLVPSCRVPLRPRPAPCLLPRSHSPCLSWLPRCGADHRGQPSQAGRPTWPGPPGPRPAPASAPGPPGCRDLLSAPTNGGGGTRLRERLLLCRTWCRCCPEARPGAHTPAGFWSWWCGTPGLPARMVAGPRGSCVKGSRVQGGLQGPGGSASSKAGGRLGGPGWGALLSWPD